MRTGWTIIHPASVSQTEPYLFWTPVPGIVELAHLSFTPLPHDASTFEGYHGTGAGAAASISRTGFTESDGTGEWLGAGIYFWESGPGLAHEWARHRAPDGDLPVVLKAKVRRGRCLNLCDNSHLAYLRVAYEVIKAAHEKENVPMPVNEDSRHDLDCRIINFLCENYLEVDTVRAPFQRGPEVYPGSAFRLHNHVQVAVRNPTVIEPPYVLVPPTGGG